MEERSRSKGKRRRRTRIIFKILIKSTPDSILAIIAYFNFFLFNQIRNIKFNSNEKEARPEESNGQRGGAEEKQEGIKGKFRIKL